jgi:hypothetical protein
LKIDVSLCADTEDNPPSYFPGWSRKGSNYEENPATIRWDWTRFWHELSTYFHHAGITITWLIRVDDGPVYDNMLKLFKTDIQEFQAKGDEIGIHIHTLFWNPTISRWIQTTDPSHEARIVHHSIELFRNILGFNPHSVRMGWNAMSNSIMNALDSKGILVDASALPGVSCFGKFDKRDNIYNWCGAPQEPYHPNFLDYKSRGDMKILEIPITSLGRPVRKISRVIDLLSKYKVIHMLAGLSLLTRKFINPHSYFTISPWWSSTSFVDKIIDLTVEKAKKNGYANIVGYFHPSDILDPKKDCENSFFKNNLEYLINRLETLKDIDVRFLTISELRNNYLLAFNSLNDQ